MTPLKEFQHRHGSAWAGVVTSEAFPAALSLAREERLREIAALTDNDIAQNAAIHLGGLRDFLKYESGLLGLHEKKEFVFGDIGTETYPDPVEEAQEVAAFEAEQESATRGEHEERIVARTRQQPKPAKRPQQKKKR